MEIAYARTRSIPFKEYGDHVDGGGAVPFATTESCAHGSFTRDVQNDAESDTIIVGVVETHTLSNRRQLTLFHKHTHRSRAVSLRHTLIPHDKLWPTRDHGRTGQL